jgi:hypothetical protein
MDCSILHSPVLVTLVTVFAVLLVRFRPLLPYAATLIILLLLSVSLLVFWKDARIYSYFPAFLRLFVRTPPTCCYSIARYMPSLRFACMHGGLLTLFSCSSTVPYSLLYYYHSPPPLAAAFYSIPVDACHCIWNQL